MCYNITFYIKMSTTLINHEYVVNIYYLLLQILNLVSYQLMEARILYIIYLYIR